MPERFGGAVLTIECPDCGRHMKETLSRLREVQQPDSDYVRHVRIY
jgi:hypothetical protein